MPHPSFRHPVPLTVAGVMLAGLLLSAFLPGPPPVVRYNSEEHQLIVDRGVARVVVPPSVRLPPGVSLAPIERGAYVDGVRSAKRLAVGFDSNRDADFESQKYGVQDNCYYGVEAFGETRTGFAQLTSNKQIHVPDPAAAPSRVLRVPGHTRADAATSFTLGQLAALYGDYRRTTWCDAAGRCFLTNADVQTVGFTKGNARAQFCPPAQPAGAYLQAIASGLIPPYGVLANTFSNTAGDTELGEAGWWGDEMLRIANINDWHFARGAIAWYTGAHRLALLYADSARTDPKHWVKALHLEANALHSLTDLFAFGHVVTNRDATSFQIMKASQPTPGAGTRWMAHLIQLGGGQRDGAGGISLSSALPPIAEIAGARNEFVASYRGSWAATAKAEHTYHQEFNASGAEVRNLNGDDFHIFGDGRLNQMTMTGKGFDVLTEAVRSSVQALFDAHAALASGSATLADLGKAGSPYFAALRHIPVYVASDANGYFTGKWTRYARAVDELTGGSRVPADWERCGIPYLSGADWTWPAKTASPCSAF